MQAIIIDGGTVEVLCVKCVCNEMRAKGRDPGQRYDFATPHGTYTWDVEAAIRLVNRDLSARVEEGRFVTFDPQMMFDWLTGLDPEALDFNHAAHVDVRMPGIITAAWDCKADRPAAVLIDGTHRMARCLRDRIPFHALILSFAESEACLLSRPALSEERLARLRSEECFPVVAGEAR